MNNILEKAVEEMDIFHEFEELPEEELDRLEQEYLAAQDAANDNDTVAF